ncbi:hypothetical protein IIV22A_161R [Invertebrate iridescent virus 22]|uniref:Uncharacterized protein n=1 Tax=Invertebrate iridescent virus 22 TaxID=345198 RepID=W8W2D3_9VIRU|nr:hypothetical protein IIV22A_161R [Invertebrate iridescent virus 22]CCV02005.1 hypothetical protein IIV22A_161R [Invertebrate iridescent virus 22]
MTSKMSMRGEDSIVGYNKKVVNYTCSYESDDEGDEEDFYDHYEPYEEDFDDDNEYQPFIPEDDDTPKKIVTKTVKPCLLLNSPTKSAEKSPKSSPTKSPSWWDKKTINESPRIVNGVLNYAALLPPPTPKVAEIVSTPPQPKKKKIKNLNQLKIHLLHQLKLNQLKLNQLKLNQ